MSPALVSKITDVVADEITAWQNRPVDEGRFPVIDATLWVNWPIAMVA
ncbi:transposase [Streptomyces sp. NPDC001978]